MFVDFHNDIILKRRRWHLITTVTSLVARLLHYTLNAHNTSTDSKGIYTYI